MTAERFDGRAVLITGAGAGIGEAAARAFAELGASVALADRDEAAVRALAGELDGAIAVAADVTSPAEVEAAVAAALESFGRLDVLVNSAGGFRRRVPTWEMPVDEWDEVVDANLKGVFLCCRAALPPMLEAGYGRIVNVSSGAGRAVTHVSASHYAAAKAGVLGLTRHLAREVADRGVTVNAVAPGTTLTPRIEQLYDARRLEEIAEGIPIGRLAVPDDHVAPIVFLASEGSRYVTGVTLDVVGGRYLI